MNKYKSKCKKKTFMPKIMRKGYSSQAKWAFNKTGLPMQKGQPIFEIGVTCLHNT